MSSQNKNPAIEIRSVEDVPIADISLSLLVTNSSLGPDSSMYFSNYLTLLHDAIPYISQKYETLANCLNGFKNPQKIFIKYLQGTFLNDIINADFILSSEPEFVSISGKLYRDNFDSRVVAIITSEFTNNDRLIIKSLDYGMPSKRYVSKEYSVCFYHMDSSLQMSFVKLANIIGEVREKFGIIILPDFVRRSTSGELLLKTHSMTVEFFEKLHFGDQFCVYAYCKNLSKVFFDMQLDFVNSHNILCASATQRIAVTSIYGKIISLPDDWILPLSL